MTCQNQYPNHFDRYKKQKRKMFGWRQPLEDSLGTEEGTKGFWQIEGPEAGKWINEAEKCEIYKKSYNKVRQWQIEGEIETLEDISQGSFLLCRIVIREKTG